MDLRLNDCMILSEILLETLKERNDYELEAKIGNLIAYALYESRNDVLTKGQSESLLRAIMVEI